MDRYCPIRHTYIAKRLLMIPMFDLFKFIKHDLCKTAIGAYKKIRLGPHSTSRDGLAAAKKCNTNSVSCMKTKIVTSFLVVFPIVTLISCRTSKADTTRTLIKEYALCKCIQFAVPNDSSLKQDISPAVYREMILYNYPELNIIDSLARKAAFSIVPSPIADLAGKRSVMMNCIGFYKSGQLDSVVRSIKIHCPE